MVHAVASPIAHCSLGEAGCPAMSNRRDTADRSAAPSTESRRPANDAATASSVVALERTSHSPASPIAGSGPDNAPSIAARIARSVRAGLRRPRSMFAPARRPLSSLTATSSSADTAAATGGEPRTSWRKVSAVTQKPAGTNAPLNAPHAASLVSSPSDAPFPPATPTSPASARATTLSARGGRGRRARPALEVVACR